MRATSDEGNSEWSDSGSGSTSGTPRLKTAILDETALELTYTKTLNEDSTPATGDYAVEADNEAVTVTNVSVTGKTVTLTIGKIVTSDMVTVSYTIPAENPVQDTEANKVAALSDQPVTNNTIVPVRVGLSRRAGAGESLPHLTNDLWSHEAWNVLEWFPFLWNPHDEDVRVLSLDISPDYDGGLSNADFETESGGAADWNSSESSLSLTVPSQDTPIPSDPGSFPELVGPASLDGYRIKKDDLIEATESMRFVVTYEAAFLSDLNTTYTRTVTTSDLPLYDDDYAQVQVQNSSDGIATSEDVTDGHVDVTILLTRSKKAGFPLLIDWAIADGTAVYGTDSSSGDYGLPDGAKVVDGSVKGTATISANETRATVSIPINNDAVTEDEEVFTFTIENVWDTTSDNPVRKGYMRLTEVHDAGIFTDAAIVTVDDSNKSVEIRIES